MKRFLLFVFAIVAFAACEQAPIEEQSAIRYEAPDTITVGFEGDDTRIQLNEAQKTVWNSGDEVSVFYHSNGNQKWQYKGEDGARQATLSCVQNTTGNTSITKTIVVYPYDETYWLNTDSYYIEATTPATQHYAVDSYGVGDNLMVSQGEFTQFSLKNVYGWLKLQLTGDGETIKSIKFRGNDGEQVAGLIYVDTATAEATLAAEMGDADDNNAGSNLVFEDTILTEVTLDCGEGVALGKNATAFYIALPPQTFDDGFTVEVACVDGSKMVKSSNKVLSIERNHIQPMAALSFVNNSNDGIYIPDEALKAYLVDNYDDDGNHEISFAEADNITMVNCSGKGVADLTGLESCPNLVILNCSNNNITKIELPNLVQLETVICNDCPIEIMNFNGCTLLQYLNLQGATTNAIIGNKLQIKNYNQAESLTIDVSNTTLDQIFVCRSEILTHLDVSKNTHLKSLEAYVNPNLKSIDVSTLVNLEILDLGDCNITNLDVSKNLMLTELYVTNNKLSTIDVSQNKQLKVLKCKGNQISNLNISNNDKLETLIVEDNKLSAINLRNNTALTYLNINNNVGISMIDVKYNTSLTNLYCNGLAIEELNIVNNTALTKLECHSNPNLTTLICNDAFDFTTTHISINKGLDIISANGSVLTPSVGDLITVNLGAGVVYSASVGSFMIVSVLETSKRWYDAKAWCSAYGTDWYWPSLSGLKSIYRSKSTVNSTLSDNGYTTLGTYYWSSTDDIGDEAVDSRYYAYKLNFSNGYSSSGSKNGSSKVRAVLAF